MRRELTQYRNGDFHSSVTITTNIEARRTAYTNGHLSFEVAIEPRLSQRRRARHLKRIEIVPGDQLLCASVHGASDLIRCRASSPSTAPSAAVGALETSLVALGNAKGRLGITREADRSTWINVVWLVTPAHWPLPKLGTRPWHGRRSSHHPLPAPMPGSAAEDEEVTA